jgi:hypothetical protein
MRNFLHSGLLSSLTLLACSHSSENGPEPITLAGIAGTWELIAFDCADQGKFLGGDPAAIGESVFQGKLKIEDNSSGQFSYHALSNIVPGLVCAESVPIEKVTIDSERTATFHYDGTRFAYLPKPENCSKGENEGKKYSESMRVTLNDSKMYLEVFAPTPPKNQKELCSNGRMRMVLSKSNNSLPIKPKMIDGSELK